MDAERARRYGFATRADAQPLRIARAEGAWLYTEEGQAILDASGGAIVSNVGHGRREVAEAYARELERLSYVLPPFATESRVRLVERLVSRWLPPGLVRVGFTSGGSESVDTALRVARLHHVAADRPGRWKVIARDLSYHGTTLATLAVGGHQKRRKGFEPWLAELPKAPACYCFRCPLGKTWPSCASACADEVEAAILAADPDTVAAVIAEPIGGSTAGALVPPDDYWPKLAEICRRHGVLLIADEVMTGFGRTGKKFAIDHFGVTPDILIGGKGLTGGYAPMGAVFATEAVVAPRTACCRSWSARRWCRARLRWARSWASGCRACSRTRTWATCAAAGSCGASSSSPTRPRASPSPRRPVSPPRWWPPGSPRECSSTPAASIRRAT